LLRRAQAFEPGYSWSRGARRLKLLICLLVVLPLCGCASGFDLGKAGVDRSISTGSIATEPGKTPDSGRLSDEATIRNAVSSADLGEAGGQALSWANAETGSRGSITGVEEYTDKDALCRRFRTTLESFDGVTMYTGEACLGAGGAWRMRAFEAL
jgi:surface antigen